MGRILLVEDSFDCQVLVRRALEDSVEINVATDIQKAQKLLAEKQYDLLLLDVNLPDGDGFGFCSQLMAQQGSARPRIFFLTGRNDLPNKLTGFSVGADDYMAKPFDPLELKARVLAHLRNTRESVLSANMFRTGNLKIDLTTHQASVIKGTEPADITLTPTEFRLLHHLARKEGQVFSREQLLGILSDGRVHVTDRTIDTHLCRLRKKLNGCSHSVEPIYGVGYRFVKKAA